MADKKPVKLPERTVKIDATPVEDCFRGEAPQDDPMKFLLSVSFRAVVAACSSAAI